MLTHQTSNYIISFSINKKTGDPKIYTLEKMLLYGKKIFMQPETKLAESGSNCDPNNE